MKLHKTQARTRSKSAAASPARRSSSAQRGEQPRPFTPGVTRLMVREHARRLYRDKLQHEALSLEDWVLAEKDLVQSLQTEEAAPA